MKERPEENSLGFSIYKKLAIYSSLDIGGRKTLYD